MHSRDKKARKIQGLNVQIDTLKEDIDEYRLIINNKHHWQAEKDDFSKRLETAIQEQTKFVFEHILRLANMQQEEIKHLGLEE
jgi:molecular chaperone GrpE (heat shock protein)